MLFIDEIVLLQLRDPSLFKQECYVGGEWVKARLDKTFEVTGNTSFEIANA